MQDNEATMDGMTMAHPAGATDPPAVMENPYGHMIPLSRIKEEEVLEHQLVVAIVAQALQVQAMLAAFKVSVFNDCDAFMELLAERYKIKMGGRRGGVALQSYDQRLKLEISVADTRTFGPELAVAKQGVDACISRWLDEGANPNLTAVVQSAFSIGKDGQVDVERVLGLRKLNITDDPEWAQAMAALTNSLRTRDSKSYVRIYTRKHCDDRWEMVNLSLAGV